LDAIAMQKRRRRQAHPQGIENRSQFDDVSLMLRFLQKSVVVAFQRMVPSQ
jgi:hypothetical protein